MTEAPDFSLKDSRLWYYRAKVIRVIDGDTAILLIDKGFHEFSVEKVRLAGIDAPELRPREGSAEQRSAEKVLASKATERLRELVMGKEVVVRTERTGKFGRWLSFIFPPDRDKSANQVLLDEDLAVRYGDPRPWRGETSQS